MKKEFFPEYNSIGYTFIVNVSLENPDDLIPFLECDLFTKDALSMMEKNAVSSENYELASVVASVIKKKFA